MASRSSTRRDSVNQSLISKAADKTLKTNEKEGMKPEGMKPSKTKETQMSPGVKAPEKVHEGLVEEQASVFSSFKEEIRHFFEKYDNTLEQKLTQFDQKFSSKFDELKKELNTMVTEVYDAKNELFDLKKKVDDMEKTIEFQAQQVEDREDIQGDLLRKYQEEIEELKKKLFNQEKKDRRYNLLFYGFQEDPKENLEEVMKNFFKSKLEIPESKVDAILIANIHRIKSQAKGPNPVIIKFVRMADRDDVFTKAFHPVLREEKKRILSDLPVKMKEERGRLAKLAYNIRQTKKKQTRIVEQGLSVYLETRESKGQPWTRYDSTNPDSFDAEVDS